MPIKLLVIDDDNAVTDLLSLLLRSQGFDVTATNSSTDGLNFIRENHPDLIVLDLMMPEMDGWQVCKAVREFSQVPIIILSALNRLVHRAGSPGSNGAMNESFSRPLPAS